MKTATTIECIRLSLEIEDLVIAEIGRERAFAGGRHDGLAHVRGDAKERAALGLFRLDDFAGVAALRDGLRRLEIHAVLALLRVVAREAIAAEDGENLLLEVHLFGLARLGHRERSLLGILLRCLGRQGEQWRGEKPGGQE